MWAVFSRREEGEWSSMLAVIGMDVGRGETDCEVVKEDQSQTLKDFQCHVLKGGVNRVVKIQP